MLVTINVYSYIELKKTKNFSSHSKGRHSQILLKLFHEKPCLIPIMGNKSSVFDPYSVPGKIRVNMYHTILRGTRNLSFPNMSG